MKYAKGNGHHRSQNAVVFDAGKPAPTPRVSPLSVACPTCGAGVKESCINQGLRTGKADKGKPCAAHSTRRRMAVRAHNREHGL